MAQLKCSNVTLGYDHNVLVEGLNLEVNAGDFLCVVGENGTGKSTLMRTILRLQQPLSGTITTGDGLSHGKIGYLPQQTQVQRDFPASVREIVISGFQAGAGPFYSRNQKKEAAEIMKTLGIKELERRCYRELSGGQQQRVLLARALCATKTMLLLDEPVTGLDPIAANEMYSLIDHLNKDKGISIIMISHDVAEAIPRATHILHLGKKVFFGTKQEYLESPLGQGFLQGGGQ
ncbi:MAG TPA: ABC transporter [Treponema sp.]|jgi:zinc transport system ATP-binding protein|nr:ABC transporter [Treponema sp.]HCA20020.1 ABC transporter [Treponema sp.]